MGFSPFKHKKRKKIMQIRPTAIFWAIVGSILFWALLIGIVRADEIDELYNILYWQRLENIIKEGDKNADM